MVGQGPTRSGKVVLVRLGWYDAECQDVAGRSAEGQDLADVTGSGREWSARVDTPGRGRRDWFWQCSAG